jgi:poly(3-hydroxybutyrate) depolymerase
MPAMRRRTVMLSATAATLASAAAAAAPEGSFAFDRAEPAGATQVPQRVFGHRPASWRADGRVVFVMHGLARDADRYRDEWVALSDRHGFLLVCPEFSREKFPGDAWYNFGGLRETQQADARAFAVPDRVFADIRARFGATATRYSLYGHSAGAQFVHRFLLLAPSAAVDQAIAANAGWYTLPVFDQDFPYGLRGTGVTEAEVETFLRRPLVLQLGEADTDPAHRSLRRDAGSDLQGTHRFARGWNFWRVGMREAERRGFHSPWRVVTVPGVGHENGRMADSAAALLFA